jgi:hypothetical protein
MIFPITTFTLIHTLLSVIGIFAGLVLAGGWLSGRQLERWSLLFLVTTFLTNLSGFGFPFVVLLPGHIIGALSLLILPFVVVARYGKHLAGGWLKVYVIGSMVLLYFNAFILVVQLFKRIPGLIAAAPTQKEPPFAITQLLVLALFLWLGREAVKESRGIGA